MRRFSIFALLFASCAEPQAEPVTAAEPAATSKKPIATATATTPPASEPTTPPVSEKRDASTPALSSPNPKAIAKDGGASEPEQPRATDPHTKAVERVAIVARSCYEKHIGNVDGRYALELTMGPEGKIKRVVLKAVEGSQFNAAYENCVVSSLQIEKLPALASNESVVEIPLQFKKH